MKIKDIQSRDFYPPPRPQKPEDKTAYVFRYRSGPYIIVAAHNTKEVLAECYTKLGLKRRTKKLEAAGWHLEAA
ncbi:hypothetical protein DFR58_10196 [Anaerobacterium chartisolvens]|uniref:Uncharacterized protein n=1 Tax=Anaerobacterium chartisolvens TaxID=1297424 RepID=A0A369BMI3_9FIRM|nr:hypothetical protein [Anaerobacterium chartisolvens]RCX20894.1 hypothetical protein DFR58_10196 [Anaerobacterium chartisolvens]